MIRHAAQHLHQRAAGFAGPHHVDIQIGKNARLLGHRIGQAPAFHHVLPQFLAHVGGDASGLKMGHAVEGDRQRHAGIEQVSQLLGEGGQFLQFGLRFGTSTRAGWAATKRANRPYRGKPDVPGGDINRGGISHGKKSQALDLNQGRRTVGDVCSDDDFAALQRKTGFIKLPAPAGPTTL